MDRPVSRHCETLCAAVVCVIVFYRSVCTVFLCFVCAACYIREDNNSLTIQDHNLLSG